MNDNDTVIIMRGVFRCRREQAKYLFIPLCNQAPCRHEECGRYKDVNDHKHSVCLLFTEMYRQEKYISENMVP